MTLHSDPVHSPAGFNTWVPAGSTFALPTVPTPLRVMSRLAALRAPRRQIGGAAERRHHRLRGSTARGAQQIPPVGRGGGRAKHRSGGSEAPGESGGT